MPFMPAPRVIQGALGWLRSPPGKGSGEEKSPHGKGSGERRASQGGGMGHRDVSGSTGLSVGKGTETRIFTGNKVYGVWSDKKSVGI